MRLFLLLFLIFIISSGLIYLILKNQAQVLTSAKITQSLEEEFGKEIAVSSGNWVEEKDTPIFDNKTISTSPQKYEDDNLVKVLGINNSSDKWLEVNLTEQKIYAWEGNQKVFEFFVSTGRPGYNTPTGEFTVWRKVLYQAYRGGSRERGDYYYLPNVPYSLFFSNNKVAKSKGYAVHGAYWHNDFGIKRRSAGCVNVRPEEAAKLYSWANPLINDGVNAVNATTDNPGIRVSIHY